MNAPILTLEDLSFKIFLKNFSHYLAALYYNSEDIDLKKNMEKLQILYSRRILTELEKKYKLKEYQLEFLLNPYLKSINIDTLLEKYFKKDFIIKKLIPIGDSLSVITCNEEDCSTYNCVPVLEAVLPHAVNISKISIPECCTDEILKIISLSCLKLEVLEIPNSVVTNVGIENFLVNSKSPLKILDITGIELSSYIIKTLLKDLPYLQELKFFDVPRVLYFVHIKDFATAKKYNLTSLNFSKYYRSQMLEKLLEMCNNLCPFLKNLVVSIANKRELEVCSKLFSELESFEINGEIDLNEFLLSKGEQLKNLTIKDSKLSVSVLIESCPNLKTLAIGKVQYLQSDRCKKNLKNMKILKLDMSFIHDKNVLNYIILLLNSCLNLEILHLCNFNSTLKVDYDNLVFSINENLKHIHFISSRINEDFLRKISPRFSSLESISFKECDNMDVDEDDVNYYFRFITKMFDGEQYEYEEDFSDVHTSDFDSSDYESLYFDLYGILRQNLYY